MEVKPDHALKYLNQKLTELEDEEADLIVRLNKIEIELKHIREKVRDFKTLLGIEVLK